MAKGIELRVSLVLDNGTYIPVFVASSLVLHYQQLLKGDNTLTVIHGIAGALFFSDDPRPGAVVIEAVPVDLDAILDGG